MNFSLRQLTIYVLAGAMGLAGCAGKGVKKGPPAPGEPVVDMRQKLLSHLEGTWEAPKDAGKTRQAIFTRDGRLTFKNGLETYNPATWSVDDVSEELELTFPSVSLDAMQIFQLYVGQGVKSFHPNQKRVVYAFTPDTWTLNIAGWEYSKPDMISAEPLPPEPVLRNP